MELIKFSFSIPALQVDQFEQVFVANFCGDKRSSTLKIIDRQSPLYDNLGDEYCIYTLTCSDPVDLYLLGRYVALRIY